MIHRGSERVNGAGNDSSGSSGAPAAGAGAPAGTSRAPQLGPGREFDLIRSFFSGEELPLPAEVVVGPGDDCAVVTGGSIALSSDLMLEGVHFRREWLSAYEIGYRAAMVSLSDLAAMAARPIGILVSLGITPADEALSAEIMQGARDAAARGGAAVLGGDLSRSLGPIVLDVCAVGEAAEPILRSGAIPGNELWVTGELGGAAAAVRALLRGAEVDPIGCTHFRRPVARTAEAIWLAERGLIRAMLDISDGLAGDAAHLARASGVAIVLEPDAIPLHPAVRHSAADEADAFELALSGGEDYELCLAVPAGALAPYLSEFEKEFGIALTRVGIVEAGSGVLLRGAGGGREPLAFGGYQHFRDL